MYVDGKFIISGSGGPLLFFDSANASGSGGGGFSVPAFALSAFSHFTSNLVQNCPTTKASRWEDCHLGVNAGAGGCGAQGAVRCQLFDTAAVLLARPGVTRLTRDTSPEQLHAFLSENGVTYPIARDDGTMGEHYAVSGVPAAALVKDGQIVWRGHPSRLNRSMLTATLR